jgi:hypothetical protein
MMANSSAASASTGWLARCARTIAPPMPHAGASPVNSTDTLERALIACSSATTASRMRRPGWRGAGAASAGAETAVFIALFAVRPGHFRTFPLSKKCLERFNLPGRP